MLSLQSVVLIGTVPVGGPFLGWLADAVGGRAPLVVGGIVSLLAAAFGCGRAAAQPPARSISTTARRRPGSERSLTERVRIRASSGGAGRKSSWWM